MNDLHVETKAQLNRAGGGSGFVWIRLAGFQART
jgi:hypothetical protein